MGKKAIWWSEGTYAKASLFEWISWLQNLIEPLDYNLLLHGLNDLPYDLRATIYDSENNYEYDIMLSKVVLA